MLGSRRVTTVRILVLAQIVTPEELIVISIFMRVMMVIHYNMLLLLVKVVMVLRYFYELCYVHRFHFCWDVDPVVNTENNKQE